jgi:hypothetical protein
MKGSEKFRSNFHIPTSLHNSTFLVPCSLFKTTRSIFLQIPACLLLTLNRFEKRLKIPLSKAFGAFSLDDLEE